MNSFSLVGADTIQIAGRVLKNLADGDVGKVSYPNDLITVKPGKDGNTIFAVNSTGQLVDLEIRVIRGSSDDRALNALLIQQLADLPSFPLMPGYVVKRIGDGTGDVRRDTYQLIGGVFVKNPGADSNVEGSTDQGVTIYPFRFALSSRAML